MRREEFLQLLEEIAPAALADEEDRGRIGLIIEGREEISKVCCALDATKEVAEFAASEDASMLVVHHNPFYHPPHTLSKRFVALLKPLLRADTNLYVMHTNFDRAAMGVNRTLAELLELCNVEELPIGLLGEFRLSPQEIAERLGERVRVIGSLAKVEKLALVGGSGFEPALIELAASRGADAFLSAELKHHVALSSPIPLLEASHYALEVPAMRRLAEYMGWRYIDSRMETGYL